MPKPCACEVSRRTLLGAAGAAGATVGLAACADAESRPVPQDVRRGHVVAQTTDIPEGGGAVIWDSKLVITQPEAGEYRAFSAVCKHAGCTVRDVSDRIECHCHGSNFDLATGEPLNGPATEPLEPFDLDIDGTDITLW